MIDSIDTKTHSKKVLVFSNNINDKGNFCETSFIDIMDILSFGCLSLLRQPVIPTAHYSDDPLFRQPITLTAHYSDGPFFRQYKIELNPQIHGLTSKMFYEKWLEESEPSVTYIFQYMNVLCDF